jgi:exopolysaccharide biosynthesis polyprenyl glycosylphosphotransferase
MFYYSQALFLYTALLKLADVLTLVAVWHASYYLRFDSSWLPFERGLPSYSLLSQASLPLALTFSAVFHLVGIYRRDKVHFGLKTVRRTVQASVVATLVFVSLCFFLYEVHYSRLFLVLYLVLAAAGLLIERAVLHFFWRRFLRTKVRRRRLLLVGSGELLGMYVSALSQRQPYPVQWIGHLGPDGQRIATVPYLGAETEIHHWMQQLDPDCVVVAYPNDLSPMFGKILSELSDELVEVKVLPDYGRHSSFLYQAQDECGIPLLSFNSPPTGPSDRVFKRFFDVLGSTLLLILFSPVFLVIGLLIKLSSRGPVLYRQTRMGVDGKLFTLYKFRSMGTDAEAKSGAVWAVKGDPRTTKFGKWLRQTSLDEIPQFYNVIRGDMSLVGPRPERPVFVEKFRKEIPKYMLRHSMKSGITGWAQINGWRGNTSIEERIKHDLYYIQNWSHYLDLKILFATLWKGFVNRHAY